jgi:integrase
MGKLTDIQIRHWLKAGQPVAKAQGDVPGLTFTLSAKGTAAWILRYRIGGKARELTIGRYPEYGIAQAKAAALEARAKIQAGADVAREKRLEHINRAGSMSFAELARDYLAKKLPGLSDSTRTYRTRHIENLIIPRMGAIQANEVNGADIVALLETIGSKHSHIVARHVLIAFNDVFKHGMAKRVITQNPCFGINVNAICGPAPATKPRLMLTEAELRQLLPNLHRLSESNGLALRIMLATCVRINELFKAKWCDVDLERGEWIVPKSKKSDQPFVIPLAPVVVDWLRRLQVLACGSPYVLPSRDQKGTRNSSGFAGTLVKFLGGLDGVRRFSPHDLRSTARSHLAALGVPVLIAERCLNHTLGGLVAVYDQHDYLTERRKALELWADYLTACEAGREWQPTGGNVVPIRTTA